jgi:hypothetical protein
MPQESQLTISSVSSLNTTMTVSVFHTHKKIFLLTGTKQQKVILKNVTLIAHENILANLQTKT